MRRGDTSGHRRAAERASAQARNRRGSGQQSLRRPSEQPAFSLLSHNKEDRRSRQQQQQQQQQQAAADLDEVGRTNSGGRGGPPLPAGMAARPPSGSAAGGAPPPAGVSGAAGRQRQPHPSPQQQQRRASSLPAPLSRGNDQFGETSPTGGRSALERDTVRAKKDLLERRRPTPSTPSAAADLRGDRDDDFSFAAARHRPAAAAGNGENSPIQDLYQRKERSEAQLRELMRQVNGDRARREERTWGDAAREGSASRADYSPRENSGGGAGFNSHGNGVEDSRRAELENKIRQKQSSWAREHWRQQHDQQRQTRYKELLALFRKRRANEADCGRSELGGFLADLTRTEAQMRDSAQRRRGSAAQHPGSSSSDWPRPAAQPQRPRSATAGGRAAQDLFRELRQDIRGGDVTARSRGHDSADELFTAADQAGRSGVGSRGDGASRQLHRRSSAPAQSSAEQWGSSRPRQSTPATAPAERHALGDDGESSDGVEAFADDGSTDSGASAASSMSLSFGSAKSVGGSDPPPAEPQRQWTQSSATDSHRPQQRPSAAASAATHTPPPPPPPPPLPAESRDRQGPSGRQRQEAERERDTRADRLAHQQEDEEEARQRALTAAQHLKHEGNQRYQQQRYGAAAACYSRAIELDPRNSTLFCNRAAAYLMAGHLDRCLTDCQSAIALDPLYTKAHFRAGKALLLQCQPRAARRYYHTAQQLLRQQFASGGADAELRSLEQRIDLDLQATTYIEQCRRAGDHGQWTEALHYAELALEKVNEEQVQQLRLWALTYVDPVMARVELGHLTSQTTRRIDRSESDGDIGPCPNMVAEQFALFGRACFYSGHLYVSQALENLRTAVRHSTEHKEAHALLKTVAAFDTNNREASNAYRGGRWQEAYQGYTATLHVDPSNHKLRSVTYNNRAAALLMMGNATEAVRDCTHAINADCTNVKAYTRRAHAHQELGNWDAAVRDLELAAQLNPALYGELREAQRRRDQLRGGRPTSAHGPRPSSAGSSRRQSCTTAQGWSGGQAYSYSSYSSQWSGSQQQHTYGSAPPQPTGFGNQYPATLSHTSRNNYYLTLGVDRAADQLTVQRRYRELAMKYHPDRVGSSAAGGEGEGMFKEINEARTVLCDAKLRADYDMQLACNAMKQ
eukprot:TRINITY_DN2473_c3_g1_i1.p1 TRINITY_DN2473_c3_g1~~TRINITY_DN2473_c3_g1_i1.p1  ORF type:complete len:1142 (+),score=387.72 TRINITY_DN2473_c3_g1_i1:119-3544(+)